jgi:hypothetical protein
MVRNLLFFGDFCEAHANLSIVEVPEAVGMEVAVVAAEWREAAGAEVSLLRSMSFNLSISNIDKYPRRWRMWWWRRLRWRRMLGNGALG